jgi:hypothetical protein
MPRNNPEGERIQFNLGGDLKSEIVYIFYPEVR